MVSAIRLDVPLNRGCQILVHWGDPFDNGYITVRAAERILSGSNLPADVLNSIWDIANVEESETFARHCVGAAVRLIGYAQNGMAISEELLMRRKSYRLGLPAPY